MKTKAVASRNAKEKPQPPFGAGGQHSAKHASLLRRPRLLAHSRRVPERIAIFREIEIAHGARKPPSSTQKSHIPAAGMPAVWNTADERAFSRAIWFKGRVRLQPPAKIEQYEIEDRTAQRFGRRLLFCRLLRRGPRSHPRNLTPPW